MIAVFARHGTVTDPASPPPASRYGPGIVAQKAKPDAKQGSGPDAVASPLPLLVAAAAVGLYAMAPGIYLGGLHVKRGAEIVDHVIPGLAVLAMVGVGLLWGVRSVTVMAVSGLIVLIAGFWMVLTHIGLFHQALDSQVSWGIAIYHCSTAVLVFAVGLTWAWRYRAGLGD